MDVHSQTLKEILHRIEAFKSEMHDTLHNFQEGFRHGFLIIHESLENMQEKCTFVNIMDECHQEVYVWYSFEDNVMIGIWIVVISGMTTTSIFYLMTTYSINSGLPVILRYTNDICAQPFNVRLCISNISHAFKLQ
jgi:hypothetical protein